MTVRSLPIRRAAVERGRQAKGATKGSERSREALRPAEHKVCRRNALEGTRRAQQAPTRGAAGGSAQGVPARGAREWRRAEARCCRRRRSEMGPDARRRRRQSDGSEAVAHWGRERRGRAARSATGGGGARWARMRGAGGGRAMGAKPWRTGGGSAEGVPRGAPRVAAVREGTGCGAPKAAER